MENLKISSVSEYISTIEQRVTETRRIYLFRGQCDSFNLLPGIARPNHKFTYSKLEVEKFILEEFKAHSLPYLKILPKNDLEYLIIAQHHGVPTRLLDWTENALAALYFAVSNSLKENMKPEVRVCSFPSNHEINLKNYDIDVFEQKAVKFFKPSSLVERIISQSGWFSMHPQTGKNTGYYLRADQGAPPDVRFSKIKLTPEAVGTIYKTLNICGVNKFSIFKDLDALGSYITSKFRGFKDVTYTPDFPF